MSYRQYSALDIAGWFINQGINTYHYMTNLVLNKLAYFAHGFRYRINDAPLIENAFPPFEAWEYGPVSPQIYHKYKYYGNSNIKEKNSINPMAEETHIYLSKYWNNFATQYNAAQLVNMAHVSGGAWDRARKEGLSIIPDNYVKEEFKKPRH